MKKSTLFLVLVFAGLVCSQSLDSKLAAFGLQDMQASVAADSILMVEYSKSVDSFKSAGDELSEVAKILDAAAGQYPVVVVRQRFDDGEILEIQGNSADGSAYLSGQLSAEDFSARLLFSPLTRGPAIIPKVCGSAVNCASDADCGCHLGESCSPGASDADERGCITMVPPENAHLEGSKYVCDAGMSWNSDLSGCASAVECPTGASEVDGACYGTTQEGGGDVCLLIFGFLLLASPFVGLAVLVLIIAAVIILLRKKKK